MFRKICLRLLLIGIILLSGYPVPAQAKVIYSQNDPQSILEQLTPAEKVGQLFVVSMDGNRYSIGSEIHKLLSQRLIGGVILDPANDNFASSDTLLILRNLITNLQNAAWQSSLARNEQTGNDSKSYVPLFTAYTLPDTVTTGGSYLPGLSAQPSLMSLGAGWDPALAKEAGILAGSELSQLGINLIIGPSLNVAGSNQVKINSLSGTNVFGGSPYWVAEMGKAFISGMNEGAAGKLAVFPAQFPGLGAADRPYETEISTVQRTLDQLVDLDLAPYLALARTDSGPIVQGFVVSPIRFNGLQGKIQTSTKPVNLDETAMDQIFTVEPLASWRQQGGLTMTADLGMPALYEAGSERIDAKQMLTLARSAFQAGNDLLLFNQRQMKDGQSFYEAFLAINRFFSSKYAEDKLFAQKVDAAVERILAAKLRIFGSFELEKALPPTSNLYSLGKNTKLTAEVALSSATLLYPSSTELRDTLPTPVTSDDRVVIFTETSEQRLCSACEAEQIPGPKALQDALLRLYGPTGTGQITVGQISAYSSDELSAYLAGDKAQTNSTLPNQLKYATWIVFNIQGNTAGTLNQVLEKHTDLIQNKKLLVFSLTAPYSLDSTEISKLTAYYALFGDSQAYFDLAARILMQEFNPKSSLPVNLDAIGYDLSAQLSPNPSQVIPVNLVVKNNPMPVQGSNLLNPQITETPAPLFKTGDLVRIQAGPILDSNGKQVPDGTPVQFDIKLAPSNFIIEQPRSKTQAGLAIIEYRIDREGIFEITAQSVSAKSSNTLVLNTAGGLAQIIQPTATPTPVPSTTPEPTTTQEALDIEKISIETPNPYAKGYPRMEDWLLVVMLLVLGAGIGYIVGFYWWGTEVWGLRSTVLALLGGLVAYMLLTVGLPSVREKIIEIGSWYIIRSSLLGMLVGWLCALIWWLVSEKQKTA